MIIYDIIFYTCYIQYICMIYQHLIDMNNVVKGEIEYTQKTLELSIVC